MLDPADPERPWKAGARLPVAGHDHGELSGEPRVSHSMNQAGEVPPPLFWEVLKARQRPPTL